MNSAAPEDYSANYSSNKAESITEADELQLKLTSTKQPSVAESNKLTDFRGLMLLM